MQLYLHYFGIADYTGLKKLDSHFPYKIFFADYFPGYRHGKYYQVKIAWANFNAGQTSDRGQFLIGLPPFNTD